jgi:hypothetical protein
MASRAEKFFQAAVAYAAYGIVYWLGGLALALAGLGPRGMGEGTPMGPGVVLLFVAGGLLIILIPMILVRERPWFDRWVLSRRDFARVLTLFVALRAFEVARIALNPRVEVVSIGGFAIPMRPGAWLFFLMTVGMVVMLARAAWSRDR